MNKYAIIVAGGSGTRFGKGLPKQFRLLCGKPVLWWSMHRFHSEDPDTIIIVVLPKDYISVWKEIIETLSPDERYQHIVVEGGDSRTRSVKNGLSAIENDASYVAVHDGARPLVSVEMIKRGWTAALNENGVVPAVPVTDSLRVISENESTAVDRSKFIAVQTPQIFPTSLLKEAYRNLGEGQFTDDASVVESLGFKIGLYEGSHENIKVTNPGDIEVAEVLMKGKP